MNNFIILLSLLFTTLGHAITINTITNYQNGAGDILLVFAEKFNTYAKENNMDINLNMVYFSKTNSSETFDYFEDFIESHFLKQFDKYELIFLNDLLISKFGEHLLDLKDYIPEETKKLYADQEYYKHCFYKNKWISLPILLDLSIMYSNRDLLNKYGKDVPTTWDELYNTAKEIIDKENPLRDKPLIGYNGLLYDGECGTCSLYEYLYSYRNSVDDSFPELTSQECIDGLTMLKKIKNDISNDEIFQEKERIYKEFLHTDDYIFSKYWFTPDIYQNPEKIISVLPGSKTGISGSIVGSNGFGINKYVNDEEKRKAAAEIIKYFSSKEFQKEMIIKFGLPTGVNSLYKDEEVCKVVDCKLFTSFQMIARPTSDVDNYNKYSKEFRDGIYSYLYGNNTIEEALEESSKVIKNYNISGSIKTATLSLFSILLSLLLYFVVF